jgi:hypothetical protein
MTCHPQVVCLHLLCTRIVLLSHTYIIMQVLRAVLALAAFLCVAAIKEADADLTEFSDAHATTSASEVAQIVDDPAPVLAIPPFMPYHQTGIVLVDDYIIKPASLFARGFRASYRGGMHALRDLLFPEFRNADRAKRSPLDGVFADEGEAELAWRLNIRHALLEYADNFGVEKLARDRPTEFRYGLAIVIGLLLLCCMLVVQACASCCTRYSLRLVFKLTGDMGWLDEADTDLAGAPANPAVPAQQPSNPKQDTKKKETKKQK